MAKHQFTIHRNKQQLENIKQAFEKHKPHFINTFENRYHISHLQIHSFDTDKYVGIASWPQFWGTIIPPVDYILISFATETHHKVHIGKKDDIMEVLKYIGVSEHHDPIHHYILPHILDNRWRKRVLEVTTLLEESLIP